MAKKALALLLALVLVLGLAACTNGGNNESTATPAADAGSSNSAASNFGNQAQTATEVEVTDSSEKEMAVTLPICGEMTSFTMWAVSPSSGADMVTANDSLARKELERRTNVHIEFEHPALGQETTAFNLMCASQQYTDAIQATNNYYVGGLDKFIDDEIIIPLEDYSEYYPNYNYWRSIQELSHLSSVTDAGHVATIYQIRYPGQPQWTGLIIRSDMFEDIGWTGGTEGIVTYDDFEEVLTLFRDYREGFVPYNFASNVGLDHHMLAGFGIYNSGGFFRLADNVVHYGPYEASYKDYLAKMADWYKKGLIDQSFYTRTSADPSTDPQNGNAGISSTFKAQVDYLNTITVDGGHWEGLTAPVKKAGDKFQAATAYCSRLYIQTAHTAITTECAPELIPVILKYHDYLYTDDGSELANYGIEGETFHREADGTIILEDFITHNEDGYSFNQQIDKYALIQFNSFRYNWTRTETNISEQARTIYKIWEANYVDDLIEYPAVSVAQDVATIYANKYNEVNTYVQEYTTRVITGQEDLDSTWNTFIQTLENLGVNDCISMQQDALDRLYSHDKTAGMN